MTNLIFTIGRELFMIRVDKEKNIFYNDKKNGVQMLYPNPSPVALKMGGPPSPDDLKEYNMCTTQDQLISFIVRDCMRRGARLVRRDDL